VKRAIATPRSFRCGSLVLEYWLGKCEGFRLTSAGGRRKGIVEEVLLGEDGRARALVVRTGWRNRRRLIDADAIEAVTPARETLTIRAAPRPARRRRQRRAAAPALGGAARALVRTTIRAQTHLRPVLAALGRSAARAGLKASVLALAATRWSVGRLRRHGPPLAARIAGAALFAAAWARPRAAALARLAAATLLTASVLLLVLVREIALATRAYATLLAREAGHKRAPAP
jgi:hypothetical protein